MYDFLNKLRGAVTVTVSGAFPEGLLNRCASSGVEILDCQSVDDYTLRLTVPSRRLERLRAIAQASMCTISDEQFSPSVKCRRHLKRRIVPVALLAVLALLLLWSKAYIWEIEVVGNETVPTGEILDVLQSCGVGIGSFWPDFTSDNIRSRVLVELPQLSWMTVNVHGSRAQVIVRERVEKPEMIDNDAPFDIFAKKDGFILNVQALAGDALVKPGQAVLKGEMLISGAMHDITGGVRTVHAYGDVTAMTYYELTAVSPTLTQKKQYTGESKSRWALVLGDKRINFYRNSSISDSDCDKIYSEYRMEIKGLFSLPVSLVKETSRLYKTAEAQADAKQVSLLLEQELGQRLLGEIGPGEIISQSYSHSESGGIISVCLRAQCRESIGVSRPMDETRLLEIKETHIEEGTS
jgi:similar to stage IV sporulation protein